MEFNMIGINPRKKNSAHKIKYRFRRWDFHKLRKVASKRAKTGFILEER